MSGDPYIDAPFPNRGLTELHGRAAWDRCYRADDMIRLLRRGVIRKGVEIPLRQFACWCARDVGATADAYPTLAAAEAYIDRRISRTQMLSTRQQALGGVGGAGVIGLPRWIVGAAVQLAAFHACSDDAIDAAEQCSRFHALGTAFRWARERADGVAACLDEPERSRSVRRWGETHRALVDRVEGEAYGRQAHVLRFLVEQPLKGIRE